MKTSHIISIFGITFITTIGLTIFTGNFLISLLIGIALFSLTYKLGKKVLKYNVKIETKYVMDSIKEYNKENNYCSCCGNKRNNENYCKKCGKEY